MSAQFAFIPPTCDTPIQVSVKADTLTIPAFVRGCWGAIPAPYPHIEAGNLDAQWWIVHVPTELMLPYLVDEWDARNVIFALEPIEIAGSPGVEQQRAISKTVEQFDVTMILPPKKTNKAAQR